jgi:hypothetical protein
MPFNTPNALAENLLTKAHEKDKNLERNGLALNNQRALLT